METIGGRSYIHMWLCLGSSMFVSLYFRCDSEDCKASFNIPSELRKHKKTHKGQSHMLKYLISVNKLVA